MFSFDSTVIGDKVINLRMTITSEKCTEGEYEESLWKKLKEAVTTAFK